VLHILLITIIIFLILYLQIDISLQDQDELIGVISIPSNLWGAYLLPGSVEISNGNITLQDDGEGNMVFNSLKYGDVIYEHGIIIVTSDGSSYTGPYGPVLMEVLSMGQILLT
jgi:hypothetical protein